LLGDLQACGKLGIQLGPLNVTLITVFIQLYREDLAEQ
jgi:hypothetical protein